MNSATGTVQTVVRLNVQPRVQTHMGRFMYQIDYYQTLLHHETSMSNQS